MPNEPADHLTWSADADDLRVEHIAAQLEEAEKQLLSDDRIEETTRARAAVPKTYPARIIRYSVGTMLNRRSEDHEGRQKQP
jgi:hypothetical protein